MSILALPRARPFSALCPPYIRHSLALYPPYVRPHAVPRRPNASLARQMLWIAGEVEYVDSAGQVVERPDLGRIAARQLGASTWRACLLHTFFVHYDALLFITIVCEDGGGVPHA